MKVGELQQQLSKLDPDVEVLCYSEDEALRGKNQAFRLLDIECVSTAEGERIRLDDERPYLRLGKSPESMVIAILEVTADF
jgi:hypothetical protein